MVAGTFLASKVNPWCRSPAMCEPSFTYIAVVMLCWCRQLFPQLVRVIRELAGFVNCRPQVGWGVVWFHNACRFGER